MRVSLFTEQSPDRHPRRFGYASLNALMWRVATAIALSLAIVPVALAQADTESPVLVDFDFNPQSADLTNGPVTISCTISLTDTTAGVDHTFVHFRSPINGQSAGST